MNDDWMSFLMEKKKIQKCYKIGQLIWFKIWFQWCIQHNLVDHQNGFSRPKLIINNNCKSNLKHGHPNKILEHEHQTSRTKENKEQLVVG